MSRQPHVIVTGATGYIGRHVVDALLSIGASVTAVVRDPSASFPSGVHVVVGDVLAADPPPLPDDADVLLHLAWNDGFIHGSRAHIEALPGHLRFVERAVEVGIPRVAVIGSMHEVGYWEGAIDEHTPTAPLSLYGVAKNALREAAAIAIADRAELLWLRCYYVVGDDRRNQSIFTKLLEAADRGEMRFPFTTGTTKYDFIDIDELAMQIAVAAITPGAVGVVNCCSGKPVSLRDRVERFIREEGLEIEIEIGAFPDRPYDSPAVWGDATRIQEIMRDHNSVSNLN